MPGRVLQHMDEQVVVLGVEGEQQMEELLTSVGWQKWIDWVALCPEERDAVESRGTDRQPRENPSLCFL